MADEPMELEPTGRAFDPRPDRRPRMDEPPPVRLVAVADVELAAPRESAAALDAFYVGLLQFEKEPGGRAVYRAENFRLRVELVEGLVERGAYRPVGIEVRSLADAQQKLMAAEMEFTWQKGLQPGTESLLMMDPGGNWVEIMEARRVG